MQCQDALELFSDYVSGDMDKALQAAFEAHLQQCPSCREGMQGFRQVWADLDRLPSVEPPPSLHERILAKLDEKPLQRQQPKLFGSWQLLWRPQVLAAAALVLIVLLAGLQFTPVRHAALGLPDRLFGWLHPVRKPMLPQPTVVWQANENGQGGYLEVQFQVPATESKDAVLHFTIALVRLQPGLPASQGDRVVVQQGVAQAGTLYTARIQLAQQPDPSQFSLLFSAGWANDKTEKTQQLALPPLSNS
ncbi:Putative zinc-finger [Chthonomonas calidirosea]|uniref:Putative zinc-finger n=1 Tax=Chthonomonas calidirosea (strain DSM 23976 / ICMP 18418 / T49) TaxID=1303518 RepID=S0EYY6_CHTCT|nr:zf-HC2 domain-containing protein [Chthonomonas calidirosea]CCW35817.1 Putative zinc-finger [Chthonomonas calidirosea T49]CEK19157.1 Putative zinc-finger [Chthonomonas calidirosea]